MNKKYFENYKKAEIHENFHEILFVTGTASVQG
jgi:hypothetical protein